MKKVLTIVGVIVVALYLLALVVPINPDEQRPGTRLGGTMILEENPDWSFMSDRQKVYVQTSTWYLIPHSVTTISFVADNQLYVPCGWCAQKRWPKNVAADPAVMVRIGDKLYPRIAVKIDQESERRRILSIPAGEPTPNFELYRMDPPGSTAMGSE